MGFVLCGSGANCLGFELNLVQFAFVVSCLWVIVVLGLNGYYGTFGASCIGCKMSCMQVTLCAS